MCSSVIRLRHAITPDRIQRRGVPASQHCRRRCRRYPQRERANETGKESVRPYRKPDALDTPSRQTSTIGGKMNEANSCFAATISSSRTAGGSPSWRLREGAVETANGATKPPANSRIVVPSEGSVTPIRPKPRRHDRTEPSEATALRYLIECDQLIQIRYEPSNASNAGGESYLA